MLRRRRVLGGGGELRAQARIDEVDVLGMALDVGGGERAGWDHGLATGPNLIEHLADEDAAQAFALTPLVDLGVGDDHAVARGPVLGPTDELAVDPQLEAAQVRVVLDDPADRSTVAGRVSPSSATTLTATAISCRPPAGRRAPESLPLIMC